MVDSAQNNKHHKHSSDEDPFIEENGQERNVNKFKSRLSEEEHIDGTDTHTRSNIHLTGEEGDGKGFGKEEGEAHSLIQAADRSQYVREEYPSVVENNNDDQDKTYEVPEQEETNNEAENTSSGRATKAVEFNVSDNEETNSLQRDNSEQPQEQDPDVVRGGRSSVLSEERFAAEQDQARSGEEAEAENKESNPEPENAKAEDAGAPKGDSEKTADEEDEVVAEEQETADEEDEVVAEEQETADEEDEIIAEEQEAADEEVVITPENTAPTSADATVVIDEDGSYTFSADDFGFNDVDGDDIAHVTITELPTKGTLALDGSPVVEGEEIQVAEISELFFTPNSDASEESYVDFKFTVNDGTDDSFEQSITIDVNAVADAPTLTAPAIVTVFEFNIDAALTDTDGSENLTVAIADIPEGVTISDNEGNSFKATEDNHSVDVTEWNMDNLVIQAPDGTDDFDLKVQSTSTEESNGDIATTTQTISVDLPEPEVVEVVAEPNNVINGTSSNNNITGTDGNDTINGLAGHDTINGAGGDDVIVGGDGYDNLRGGDGDDRFEISQGDDYDDFDGGAGTDRVVATEDNVTIGINTHFNPADSIEEISADGHSGVTVAGDNSNNNMDFSETVLTDIDKIDGGTGHDTITGSAGDDVIVGGSGTDTVVLSGNQDEYIITDNEDGTYTVEDIVADRNGTDTVETVENLRFADGTVDVETAAEESAAAQAAIVAAQDPEDQTIEGTSGAEDLRGGDGNDTLVYNADSTWSGYSAHNVETGENVALSGSNRSSDVFDGGDGYDTIEGTSGDDALFLDDGISGFASGSQARIQDVEEINMGGGDDIVDMTSNTLTYDQGISVNGGDGDDTIWTSTGNDTINGGSGDDSMYGGDGSDTLTFMSNQGDDTADGGAGDSWMDTIELSGFDGSTSEDGWTLSLDQGSVVSTDDVSGEMLLSQDSAGSITFDDGGTITFENIENITW